MDSAGAPALLIFIFNSRKVFLFDRPNIIIITITMKIITIIIIVIITLWTEQLALIIYRHVIALTLPVEYHENSGQTTTLPPLMIYNTGANYTVIFYRQRAWFDHSSFYM